jgi:hypothetical protein
LTANRPDIVFSVGLCARFQSSPKESHLVAIKRIFRYLIGTQDVRLRYKKGTHFDLQAYCDADYAGDKIERKSISGACCHTAIFDLNSRLIVICHIILSEIFLCSFK